MVKDILAVTQMFFVTNLYRSIKLVFSSLGVIGGGIVLVFGTLKSGGTILIIGGSIALTSGMFGLWETAQVTSNITKRIKDLNLQINDLVNHNKIQQTNILNLGQKNQKLQDSLNYLDTKLSEMKDSKHELIGFQEELMKLLSLEPNQVGIVTDQNSQITTQIKKILSIKTRLLEENNEYQRLLEVTEDQIQDIEETLLEVKEDRDDLFANNRIINEEILKQNDIIRESKELMISLSYFGDEYQKFSSTIDTNLVTFDGTDLDLGAISEVLRNVIDHLQTFSQKGQEKYITKEEFTAALEEI